MRLMLLALPLLAAAASPAARVDLDVDTDRDGVVEDAEDEAGEDAWTRTRGAIYSVNFDRDGRRMRGEQARPDAIHFNDAGRAVDEDYALENEADAEDLAPLVVRGIAPASLSGRRVFLKAGELEDVRRVHVFRSLAPERSNRAVWGSMTGPPPPPELDITNWVDPAHPDFQGDPGSGDVTFGIEGLSFRNVGTEVPQHQHFDGYIDFTLELREGAQVLAGDTVRLKVAPWIMLSREQASREVWAEDANELNDEFLLNSRADTDAGYRGLQDSGQLRTAAGRAAAEQWLQDHVEIGYTQRPGGPRTYVVFRLPYRRVDYEPEPEKGMLEPQPAWPMIKLLKSGVGVFQLGVDLGAAHASGDFGGNLEALPPGPGYPLGRAVLGGCDTASPRLRRFLWSQEVQSPLCDVPVGWLSVAHLDEVVCFLGDGRVAVADPAAAWALLAAIPSEERGGSVFFATGARPVTGTAAADSRADLRLETGDDHTGGAWSFVRVYAGKEAGTVGAIGEVSSGYLTVTQVWRTTSKLVCGAAPDHDIEHWSAAAEAPAPQEWRPAQGDQYVLCEGSRRWITGTPAIVTAAEVLADADFEHVNTVQIQRRMDHAKTNLLAAVPGLQFLRAPALFFARADARGELLPHSAAAFNPGPTNIEEINGALYVGRQFGPTDASGADRFEQAIAALLPRPAVFVDCWHLYHRMRGGLHCGVNVKRDIIRRNWWELQP